MSLSVVVLGEVRMLPISLILRLVSVLNRTPSCKSFLMLLDFGSSWSFSTCFSEFVHVLFVIVHVFLCSAVDAMITPGKLQISFSHATEFPVHLELEVRSYSLFLHFSITWWHRFHGAIATLRRLWLLLLRNPRVSESYFWSRPRCQNPLEYDSISVIANNSINTLIWHWLMYNNCGEYHEFFDQAFSTSFHRDVEWIHIWWQFWRVYHFPIFSWIWLTATSQSIRSLRPLTLSWQARTSGADKGNQTVHTHNALTYQTRGIRLFNHLLEQRGKSFVQCSAIPWSDSSEWIHGWYSVVEQHAQKMLQLLDLVCVVWVGKPGRPEQIADFLVPQIEEEITEVDKIPSLCEAAWACMRQAIRSRCVWWEWCACQSTVMRVHDIDSSAISCLKSLAQVVHIMKSSCWAPLVVDRLTEQAKLAQ